MAKKAQSIKQSNRYILSSYCVPGTLVRMRRLGGKISLRTKEHSIQRSWNGARWHAEGTEKGQWLACNESGRLVQMRMEGKKKQFTQGFLDHGVDSDFKFSGKPLEVLSRGVMLLCLLRKIIHTPIWKMDCSVARVNRSTSVGY